MNIQIEKLLQLQDIDYEIYNLKQQISEKPEEINSIKDNVSNAEEKLRQNKEELKQLEINRKNKEIELESNEQEIKKYESQLYQVKTNKEYSALEHEIESVRADNSVLEEEIINQLDNIDSKKKTIESIEQDLDNEKKMLVNRKKEIELDIKEFEHRINKLNANRKEIIKDIDAPDLLDKYERILKNKRGIAMAKVVNGTCGSCYMNLPPQSENEIRLGGVITCQNCSKILYMEDV